MAKVTKKKSVTKRKKKGKSYWFVFLIFLILIVVVVAVFLYRKQSTTVKAVFRNIPEGFSSFGIDVSHHQGTIDWKLLLTEQHFDTLIHFVYCKATEGNTYLDAQWENNRSSLNNMGIPNGAYHFFTTTELPRPQVHHFLNHWKMREVDLPPVLDVETEGFSDEDLRAKMLIWLTEVENETGMRPIIYTSLHFFETKFRDYFSNYKFWIATYSKEPGCIKDKRIVHWQYRIDGRLPGVKEHVDFNVSTLSF